MEGGHDKMDGGRRCVLIVDDEERMVRALKDFFRARNFSVLMAYNGSEALDVYYGKNNLIDIVLLDVMMPEVDGIETLRNIRREDARMPIIMLTAKGEEYDELAGFNCGADDYIVKPFSTAILFARVEALLRRYGKDVKNEIEAGGVSVHLGKYEARVDGHLVDLTNKEFNLLCYLMNNQSLILRREELLDRIWGFEYEGDVRTVDTHIKQLREKLGEKARYIKTEFNLGYRFEVC